MVDLDQQHERLETPDGQRVAVVYTKVHHRLLRPLIAANTPPAPLPLRQALRAIDHHIDDYITEASIIAAAEGDAHAASRARELGVLLLAHHGIATP